MVLLNWCIVFTRVFHFAMDLGCFAHWVSGCANCVRCIEKQNKAVKIVFKQSRKTVNKLERNGSCVRYMCYKCSVVFVCACVCSLCYKCSVVCVCVCVYVCVCMCVCVCVCVAKHVLGEHVLLKEP